MQGKGMFRPTHFYRWILHLLAITTAATLVGCDNTTAVPTAEPMNASEVITAEPLSLDDALPPVSLAIPEIDLETDVTPMGWRISQTESGNTTVWDVPYSTAGWHVTSAGAGAEGNVILSGHQVIGEAVFEALALGEVEVGQQIYLTNEDDETFVYEVTTVADPIPLVGATVQDLESAEAFVAPSEDALLTLVTGWPDFSTTHYLFVSAEFIGIAATDTP